MQDQYQTDHFLHGACDELAVGLYNKIGGDLIAAIYFNENLQETVLVHCWVRYNDRFIDASGFVDVYESLEKYPEKDEASLIVISLDELKEITGNKYTQNHYDFLDSLVMSLNLIKE